ncbi:MAG: hypothetical protein Q8S00_16055 [Deltaproteobacteria bacterium]|nr:hypothetical protein [Deltaproteobacteria bacterium]
MSIEAADKSWGLRMAFEGHLRMLFEAGKDQVGRTNGEIMGRRFRPEFYFCIKNCLFEIEAKLDLDGFGSGNAWNSNKSGATSILQRGAFHFHAEDLNPYMPTVTMGMDISTSSASNARQGSSSTGSQREYDILSRQAGPNTGRAGQGIVLTWDNRSLSSIGIPGRLSRFQVSSASISEGDDGASSFKDRRNYGLYLGVEPFQQLKNKWIRGLKFDIGAWFCNVDKRAFNGRAAATTAENGCDRMRLRDHGDAASQTIFDTGADSVGGGLYHFVQPGFQWEVGPYRLRAVTGYAVADDDKGAEPGKKRGRNFMIGHDLFIWSPKGFLTGSATTAGSIMLGTHFERNDMSCTTAARCSGINGGQFHRETLLLREWDIYYFIAPRMSVGYSWLWYDASNLRTGKNRAGENLGVFPVNCPTATCRGRGGDWLDMSLDWRWYF